MDCEHDWYTVQNDSGIVRKFCGICGQQDNPMLKLSGHVPAEEDSVEEPDFEGQVVKTIEALVESTTLLHKRIEMLEHQIVELGSQQEKPGWWY